MASYLSLFLLLTQAINPIPPFEHPLTITATSWVVLDIEIGAQGYIQSEKPLQGANPFLDIAVQNARVWTFTPGTDSRVTAVFLFRARDFFSGPSTQPQMPLQLPPRTMDHPPIPVGLLDPGYPVNSIGEGVTVLELQINAAGNIDSVRVVGDAPGLAAHTEKTIQSWKFEPDIRNGAAVRGKVIVVASYLRPIVNINFHPIPTPTPYYPYPPSGPEAGQATFTTNAPAPRRF